MSTPVTLPGRSLKENYSQICDEKNRVTVYFLNNVHLELMRLIENKALPGCSFLTMSLIQRLRIPNQIVGYSRRHPDDKLDVMLGMRLAKRNAFDKFESFYQHLLCELANELGKAIGRIDSKLGIR